MLDLHCHLLPGIDDGPRALDEAIAQARAHVAAGVATVVCTPHVSQSHRNTAASIAAATAALQRILDEAGVALRVLPGAEVSLSRAIELDDHELRSLHLAGSGWLLLEAPLATDVPRLAQTVQGLQARGHRILLAHPERCAAFHRDPQLLGVLVRHGALAQVTAGSLTGDFGRTVERLARAMVDDELVHVVASDAHDLYRRAPGLAEPLRQAQFAALTPWACAEVPAALLAGAEVPPRPLMRAPSRRRGLLRRR